MVKMPPRVAVEALVALLFVGCIFMALDQSETAAAPTLISIKSQALFTSQLVAAAQCQANPAQEQKNTNIKYSCSWLNQHTGCCNGPQAVSNFLRSETQCSDQCYALYFTYWCITACDARTVTICTSSLQSLFNACSSTQCGLIANEQTLASPNPAINTLADFLARVNDDGQRVISAASNCIDLTARFPASTPPSLTSVRFDGYGATAAANYTFPSLREQYVNAAKIAAQTPGNVANQNARDAALAAYNAGIKTPRFVTVNIEVTSATQVLFGKFTVQTPDGSEAQTIAITDWELKAGTTNVYIPSTAVSNTTLVSPWNPAANKAITRPVNTIQPTFLGPTGMWRVTSVYAVNHAGSFTTTPANGQFWVTATFPRQSYPVVKIASTATTKELCRSDCFAEPIGTQKTASKCQTNACYQGCPDACEDCLNDDNTATLANSQANLVCPTENGVETCYTNINSWSPFLNTAAGIEFGCSASSPNFPITLQQGYGTASLSVNTINFNAPVNVISGLSVSTNDATFTLARGTLARTYDQTLTLSNGAQLLVKGVLKFQECSVADQQLAVPCSSVTTTIQGDMAKAAVRVASTGTFDCTQNVIIGVPLEVNGTFNTHATCNLAVSGLLRFGTGSLVTFAAGAKGLIINGDTVLSGSTFACANNAQCPALQVRSGTTTITSTATVNVDLVVGAGVVTSKALVVATQPTIRVCSGKNPGGKRVTITQDGVMEILPCTAPECSCFGAARIAHTIPNNGGQNGLVLQAGATLKFTEVGNQNAKAVLLVDDTNWDFRAGSTIFLQLSNSLGSDAQTIELMYFRNGPGKTCSDLKSTITWNPKLDPRVVSVQCTVVTAEPLFTGASKIRLTAAATYNVLTLTIGPSVPSGGGVINSPSQYQYNSTDIFTLLLNKECGTFGPTDFVNAVATSTLTGRSATAASQVYVISSRCGSVVIDFRCQSSQSPQDATNLCYTIISDAVTPGTQLYNKVQGIRGGVAAQGSSSNSNALYALFALLAIPVILIIACCLIVKARRREADNQYMQDTATFSNVAASPQPITAQPGLYPAGVAPVVVHDQYLHKPY